MRACGAAVQEYPQETVVYLDPNSGDPLYGCDRVTECTNATSTVTKFVEELKLFRQLRVAQLHPKVPSPNPAFAILGNSTTCTRMKTQHPPTHIAPVMRRFVSHLHVRKYTSTVEAHFRRQCTFILQSAQPLSFSGQRVSGTG